MIINIFMAVLMVMLAVPGSSLLLRNRYITCVILSLLYFVTTLLIYNNFDNYLYGPESISDTQIYVSEFLSYRNLTFKESLVLGDKEFFFTFFSWMVSKLTKSPYIFLILIWLFCSIFLLKSLKMLFTNNETPIVFFTFINLPPFLTYVINGMRQGFGMVLLFYAIAIFLTKKKKNLTYYFVLLIASLSHVATIPFIIILLLVQIFPSITLKKSLVVWVVSAILLLSHLNRVIFGSLASTFERLAPYAESGLSSGYSATNRLDFLIFSMFFVILGVFFSKNINIEFKEKYEYILIFYILFNSLYLIFGFITFSNRLSAFSWFLIPLLIWYPLLKNRENNLIVSLGKIAIIIIVLIVGSFTSAGTLLF